MMNVSKATLDRFWSKVDKSGDCWEWTAATSGGYGRFGMDGRSWRAHRVAYILILGEFPEGLELDHLCRNKRCVNPAHLEPVTHHVNVLRGECPSARRARRTLCIRGHALGPVRAYPSGAKRQCDICEAERRSRRRALSRVA